MIETLKTDSLSTDEVLSLDMPTYSAYLSLLDRTMIAKNLLENKTCDNCQYKHWHYNKTSKKHINKCLNKNRQSKSGSACPGAPGYYADLSTVHTCPYWMER